MIVYGDGDTMSPIVAVTKSDDGRLNAAANAEFIVRACNAHNDLLDALRSVPTLGVYESDHDYAVRMAEWLSVRNAAIARAEGKSISAKA